MLTLQLKESLTKLLVVVAMSGGGRGGGGTAATPHFAYMQKAQRGVWVMWESAVGAHAAKLDFVCN